MFIAGEDPDAKSTVTEVLHDFGWPGVYDLGGIESARLTESLCLMWVVAGVSRRQVRARLQAALALRRVVHRFCCHRAISPPAGVATTLRQPAGPSRGSSRTEAPSRRARRVASAMSVTST